MRECPTEQCFPTKRSYVNKSCFNLSKILIEKMIKQKAYTIKAGLFLFLKQLLTGLKLIRFKSLNAD
jgi:hypothetical protein